MNWKNIQWVIIIVLSLVTIVGVAMYIDKGKEIDKLNAKKDAINVPNKQTFDKELTQDEVARYQDVTKSKMDDFKNRKLDEGTFNTNNSGVMTIKALFSPPGGYVINEKTPVKKYIKYYSSFKYDLKNFSARSNGSGGADVFFRVDMKQDDNEVNPEYDLVKLQFNQDDELIGGSIYAKSSE